MLLTSYKTTEDKVGIPNTFNSADFPCIAFSAVHTINWFSVFYFVILSNNTIMEEADSTYDYTE